ncbi:hypothetical protein FACUT_4781 [Fusarium acutatum]|uniref:Uncharacterized protein n=1 Tax=Fusarium acutatum TaxID=78861 RepID=A0A8H4JUT9_9HYPO|nr:hypothetical protein FACUT_4781 [Fusarium acutatum]
MASPEQDIEINMSKAQIKKSNSEMKKKARFRIHEANIDWLNKEWQGPDWFPTHLLRPSKPCPSVVRGLKNITEEAMTKNIPLSSLWESGGCLRSVVEQDLATRKAGRNAKHKHPQSGRLTKKMVNHARKNLSSSTAETGNDCNSTTDDDSEVEAPEKSNTVSRLSSSALNSSAKQRLQSPLHGTITSTEDEHQVSPRGAKRPSEDEENEASNLPPSKSPRLTIDDVLGNLSSDRIETAHRIIAIEFETALAVKNDAEKTFLDLLHRDKSVAVTQTEKVQARNRKQEADELFRQVHERLYGPSRMLTTLRNLKKTFDACALCELRLERVQKKVQVAKVRLEKAQENHDDALKSNLTDDFVLESVWDMFKMSNGHGEKSG